MADLPGAVPHLTLGYTTFSPLFVAEKLKAARAAVGAKDAAPREGRVDAGSMKEAFAFPKRLLWSNTVFPASEADNWFVSGTAAYHALLRRLPENPDKARESLGEALADLNARYAYLESREGRVAPAKAATRFDRYADYQMPRIKGTVLLHQLRLLLGNAAFAKVMGTVHGRFPNRPMATEDFVRLASGACGRDLRGFVGQWVDREDLPDPKVQVSCRRAGGGWETQVRVTQPGVPYHFVTSLEIRDRLGTRLERLEVKGAGATFTFHGKEKPLTAVFNPGRDILVPQENPYVLPNQMDDFSRLLFVHGTGRQVEANRSLALNYREMLADAFTEVLPPLKPDAEVTEEELREKDLVLFGSPEDNGILARMAQEGKLPVTFGKGFFRFQGRTYGRPEDGLALALPSPYNPRRALYLYAANSALELWQMTHTFQRGLGGWVLYGWDGTAAKGYHREDRFRFDL
jgi:hypothetical protein